MTLKWSEDLVDKQVILLRTIKTGGTICSDGIWYPDQAGGRYWIEGLEGYHSPREGADPEPFVIVRKDEHIKDSDHPWYKREYFYLKDLAVAASQVTK